MSGGRRTGGWWSRATMIWAGIDVRGVMRAEPWVAAVALGCVAFTSSAATVLYAGVASLTLSLQAELETGATDILTVRADAPHAACTLDDVVCPDHLAPGTRPMATLGRAASAERHRGNVVVVTSTEGAVRARAEARRVEVLGVDAAVFGLQPLRVLAGRVWTTADERARRPVAVIGRQLYDTLTARGELRTVSYATDALAQLRYGGVTFDVIGVVASGAVAAVQTDRALMVPRVFVARAASRAPPYLLGRLEVAPGETSLLEHWHLLVRRHPGWAQALTLSTTRDQLGEVADLGDTLRAGVHGLSVVLVLAALVAVSALLVTVARAHERAVGIARALGATRRTVVLQGALVGAMIGGVGVTLGALLSLAVMAALPGALDLPALDGGTVAVTLLRGAIPSLGASVVVGTVAFARLARRRPSALLG